MPGILKRLELWGGFGAVVFLKKHVVGSFAVERRVEVDKVNGFIRDIAAEDFEIVTVVKRVHEITFSENNGFDILMILIFLKTATSQSPFINRAGAGGEGIVKQVW